MFRNIQIICIKLNFKGIFESYKLSRFTSYCLSNNSYVSLTDIVLRDFR